MSNGIPVIVQNDQWLNPYKDVIVRRYKAVAEKEKILCKGRRLQDFATGHLYFGVHKEAEGWVFREWAPNATEVYMVGDFSSWKIDKKYAMKKLQHGNWELKLPMDALEHQQHYKLFIRWEGGEAYRLPAWGNRMVQDMTTLNFDAEIWAPDKSYVWKNMNFVPLSDIPFIYEAHVGMATNEEKVGNFIEFRDNILPRIKKAGYNVIQLMAIQEHPYYGSFGYHVSNFFAVSSRFGTPDDLKSLVDAAHGMGIAVIMDLVHSHSVKNESEGLAMFDGTPYQYFHAENRRMHVAWDSLCFNYAKPEVIHFLLSNCQYWLDEYHFDGFRLDGVTSMLYYDHGLNRNFTSYKQYFDDNEDEDAIVYLCLANKLIHETHPRAITIAEEMSGMPGLAAPIKHGGYGFDYRLAMGIPDYWIKIIKELPDEKWNVGAMYNELIQHRAEEKTISYTESHDQALVGDKTIFFRLTDKEMYYSMNKSNESLIIDRGLALHKMIRLFTLTTSGGGYLNFMGNEFGHPEWIDFPREGNNWSYKYARRQWELADNRDLKYHWLLDFETAMLNLIYSSDIFEVSFPFLIHSHESNQVLAYARKDWLFVFNFNPVVSFEGYKIPVDAGKYSILLTTDETGFGGQNRIDKAYVYFTTSEGVITTLKNNQLALYLPARTAMVLQRIPLRSVYGE
jgi:1,4-alpha-glucan branching enzyme